MKVRSTNLALIVIILIFGSITLSSLLGLWKTTNDKVPAVYKSGEFAGQYDPSDIRGSYTFDDIFNTFEVPVEDLGTAFGIKDPSRYSSFQCKELETMYASFAAEGKEIGTGSVRYFVALYKGLPIIVEKDTYLPKSAVEVLKSKAKLTAEQINYIEKYSVDPPKESVPALTTKQEKTSEVRSVKGSTTFQELLDWGVKKGDIEKAINDKLTDPKKIIKDYASSKGMEFISIKDPLQKLVDALNK